MKKAGDLWRNKRESINTFSDIIIDAVRSLEAFEDIRFKRFWEIKILPVYRYWLQASKRVNVIIGGNKSGKTMMGVLKAISVYCGMVPPDMRKYWKQSEKIPLHRARHVRIIVQDYTKHYPETIRPLLLDTSKLGLLPEAWAKDYNEDEHIFYGPDGSYLSIVAIDPKQSDEDKVTKSLRGPLIDYTYIDELTLRSVYTESLTRNATLKDSISSVDLGFCPQEGYDWTYHDLYMSCYNSKDEELPEDKKHPEINVVRVTMKDNPYIGHDVIESYLATLKKVESAYRVYGLYAEHSGRPYFQCDKITHWIRIGCIRRGEKYVIKNKDIDVEDGIFNGDLCQVGSTMDIQDTPVWEVWELPKVGEYYLITVDPGEGVKEGDYSVADVWRCSENGQMSVYKLVQVAQIRSVDFKPGDFIEDVCCMGNIYGGAVIAIELGYVSGGSMRDRARNYCNLYKRRRTNKTNEDETDLIGWITDRTNKAAALDITYKMLQTWDDKTCGLRSQNTARELLVFEERIERDKKTQIARQIWKAGRVGMHDDTITTLWMAAYIATFQKDCLTKNEDSFINKKHAETLSFLEEKAMKLGQKKNNVLNKKPSLLELSRQHHGNYQQK